MKKQIIALMLALLTLTAAFYACAEGAGSSIEGSIADGAYTMTFPPVIGAWEASVSEEGALTIASETLDESGHYTVTVAAAVENGAGTLTVARRVGPVRIEAHTADLTVENGAVTELTGGSHTVASPEDDLAEVLVGEWNTDPENNLLVMTIARGAEGGFDVEIVSAVSHGALLWKMTVYEDCVDDALVYVGGTLYNAPITDTETTDVGEPIREGLSGSFKLGVREDGTPFLTWDGGDATAEEFLGKELIRM